MTATDGTSSTSGLHIEADLTVGLAASTVRVQSDAGRLYIEARSFAALRELQTAVDGEAVAVFQTLTSRLPLKIETPVVLRVRGVAVGRYRPGEPAGRLAEAVGIAPFSLSLGGILRAWSRRLRPVQ